MKKSSSKELQAKSIIVTISNGGQLIVHRMCSIARAQGVREGISVELARALSPDAYFFPSDTARDFEELRKLALWCTRFTPLVGFDNELIRAFEKKELDSASSFSYGIILDLTGTERLHGQLDLFAHKLAIQFFKRGIDVKIALTPTIGSSWAISRYTAQKSPVTFFAEHEIEKHIGYLPIHALRIDDKIIQALHDVGIVWIKDLLALPRRTLGIRYGKHLLCKLEQALGFTVEGLTCVKAPRTFTVSRKFETPIVRKDSLVIATRKLLEKLCIKLTDNHAKAGMFSLDICSREEILLQKQFSLTLASGNEQHIISVLSPLLESLSISKEVYSLQLHALDVVSTRSTQSFFVDSDTKQIDEGSIGELLNTFTMRLGNSQVQTVSLKESHIPERSVVYSTLHGRSAPNTKGQEVRSTFSMTERPSLLYTTPQPIRTIAMLPDKPPTILRWGKSSHRIVLGIGPERISAEWWDTEVKKGALSERDYFKVQNEKGQWFWIYRSRQTMEWFIHGVWA